MRTALFILTAGVFVSLAAAWSLTLSGTSSHCPAPDAPLEVGPQPGVTSSGAAEPIRLPPGAIHEPGTQPGGVLVVEARHPRVPGAPLEVAPPPRPVIFCPECGGFVIEVTKSSISIQGMWATIFGTKYSRWDERRRIHYEGDLLSITINGRKITGVSAIWSWESLSVTDAAGMTTIFRRVDQPIWRFEASGQLLIRELSPFADGNMVAGSDTYRLSDVHIGDIVSLVSRREEGINICDTICIMRRPGGQVPPAPGEPLDRRTRFHRNMQEAQDREEWGGAEKKADKFEPEKNAAPPKISPARP